MGGGYPFEGLRTTKRGTSRHPLFCPPKAGIPSPDTGPLTNTPLLPHLCVPGPARVISQRFAPPLFGRNDIYAVHLNHHCAEATPGFL